MEWPPVAGRRSFLRTTGFATGFALALGPRIGEAAEPPFARPGGPVPRGESWAGGGVRDAAAVVSLVGPDEPGTRLVLSGTVFGADGRTAMPGVTVYVYQTDARGLYNREGRNGVPHRIRGWARTDEAGRYQFFTIKPGHYPDRTIPAHIHMTVSSDRLDEWWLPEVRFEGDPLLGAADYRLSAADGRFGNVRPLVAGPDGALRCTRNLRI
jgi:protocatechuate 3,4-dioxygenase beta subunit